MIAACRLFDNKPLFITLQLYIVDCGYLSPNLFFIFNVRSMLPQLMLHANHFKQYFSMISIICRHTYLTWWGWEKNSFLRYGHKPYKANAKSERGNENGNENENINRVGNRFRKRIRQRNRNMGRTRTRNRKLKRTWKSNWQFVFVFHFSAFA